MKVKFFASFASLTRLKEAEYSVSTIEELLQSLVNDYGEPMQNKLYPKGSLDETLVILVNGRHIRHLEGIDTKLGVQDTVSIFPMVGGG